MLKFQPEFVQHIKNICTNFWHFCTEIKKTSACFHINMLMFLSTYGQILFLSL